MQFLSSPAVGAGVAFPGGGGGGATVGTTTVDFGTGALDASATVASATIVAGKLPMAWVFPAVTADNTADNHRVEDLTCIAGDVVDGVGFSIYVRCNTLRAHGIYNLAWSYS